MGERAPNGSGDVSQGRASSILQQAREVAWSVAARAGTGLRQHAEKRRDGLLERVAHVQQAVGRAADVLHERGESTLAAGTERVADVIGGAVSWVSGCSAADVASAIDRAARARPMLFAAGFFAFGFAVARLQMSPVDETLRHEGEAS